ncbi:22078_t:CDS:2 [Dentiscutata erythropus]|uniref:22078_t:CDS:1 n=1 Tax=Dentiscutata erythropus TaxID=1348616 RepID=A0A9N9H9T2_9GLOM|nr:22078_t:CDS:2 [Dentiscutata erythropus]
MLSDKNKVTEVHKLMNVLRQRGCVDTLEHVETKTNLVNMVNDSYEQGIFLDSIPFEYFKRYNRALTYSEKLHVEDIEEHMPDVFYITKIGPGSIVLKIQPHVRCMLGTDERNNQKNKEQYTRCSSHSSSLNDQVKEFYRQLNENSQENYRSRNHDKWEDKKNSRNDDDYKKNSRNDDDLKKNTKGPPWTNPYGSLPPYFQNEKHQDERYQNDHRKRERSYDKYSPERPLRNSYRDLSPSECYLQHEYDSSYDQNYESTINRDKMEKTTKLVKTADYVKKNDSEKINDRSRESGFEKYRELVKNFHGVPFFILREDAPNLSEIQRVALELLFL